VSARRDWIARLYAGGVTPASFLPDASAGRTVEPEDLPGSGVELVEGDELRVHPVVRTEPPGGLAFLDGIQQWKVIGYDGVTPIALAYVAAAVRRVGPDRRLTTAAVASREIVLAPEAALTDARRRAIEAAGLEPVSVAVDAGQPSAVIEALRRAVHHARQSLEKSLGEAAVVQLGADQWLVVDGQLSVSATLARHARTLGVIKSHGAQFLEGRHLERALTVPAAHRTSVFRVLGGHGRTAVSSWYLRLWPWEGHDLHYGLLRIEAHAHADAIAQASWVGGWLLALRAPLAAPDARFDRLLYPIHDVETLLRSRAPRDLLASSASRLPRTGT
jgi:hypothetical protein